MTIKEFEELRKIGNFERIYHKENAWEMWVEKVEGKITKKYFVLIRRNDVIKLDK